MLIAVDKSIVGGKIFAAHGNCVVFDYQNPSPQSTALIVRSGYRVDAALLQRMPALRFVASPISGNDHLDMTALSARGVTWHYAPGCNAHAVSDYVLILLASSGFLLPLICGDRHIAIIGLGHVGYLLAQRLLALNVVVCAYDPLRENWPPNIVRLDHLEQAAQCDVISVHCNLHERIPYGTRGILAQDFFDTLRAPQLLINAARGAVINQTALQQRLRAPQAPQVILDVWKGEPCIEPDLVSYLLTLTPHIAGHTRDAYTRGLCTIYSAFCTHFAFRPQSLAERGLSNCHESIESPNPMQPKYYPNISDKYQYIKSIYEYFPLIHYARAFQRQVIAARGKVNFSIARRPFTTRCDMLKTFAKHH